MKEQLYFLTYLTGPDKFLDWEGEPIVKFGFTGNIPKRIDTYRSNLPLPLLHLCTIPGGYKKEQQLLKEMTKQDMIFGGEWVYYSKVKEVIEMFQQKYSFTPHLYPKKRLRVFSDKVKVVSTGPGRTRSNVVSKMVHYLRDELEPNTTITFKELVKELSLSPKDRKTLINSLDPAKLKKNNLGKDLSDCGVTIIKKAGRYGGTSFIKNTMTGGN